MTAFIAVDVPRSWRTNRGHCVEWPCARARAVRWCRSHARADRDELAIPSSGSGPTVSLDLDLALGPPSSSAGVAPKAAHPSSVRLGASTSDGYVAPVAQGTCSTADSRTGGERILDPGVLGFEAEVFAEAAAVKKNVVG